MDMAVFRNRDVPFDDLYDCDWVDDWDLGMRNNLDLVDIDKSFVYFGSLPSIDSFCSRFPHASSAGNLRFAKQPQKGGRGAIASHDAGGRWGPRGIRQGRFSRLLVFGSVLNQPNHRLVSSTTKKKSHLRVTDDTRFESRTIFLQTYPGRAKILATTTRSKPLKYTPTRRVPPQPPASNGGKARCPHTAAGVPGPAGHFGGDPKRCWYVCPLGVLRVAIRVLRHGLLATEAWKRSKAWTHLRDQ